MSTLKSCKSKFHVFVVKCRQKNVQLSSNAFNFDFKNFGWKYKWNTRLSGVPLENSRNSRE